MRDVGSSLGKAVATSKLRRLAELAIGQRGADIERLVREARQRARRERRSMVWADLERGLTESRVELPPDLRQRMAVHEAGHAIAWTILGLGRVESVAIGTERGGQVKAKSNNLVTQDEAWLTNKMACALAGRAAETVIFGDVMIGSGGADDSDLAKATEYAMDAETALGLSQVQPLIYRPPRSTFDALLVDHTLAERVNGRLVAAEQIAVTLLTQQRATLIALADAIAERGVIDGQRVRNILSTTMTEATAE